MNDYYDFPPRSCLTHILKNCPRAALVFIFLWKNKKKNDLFFIQKKKIRRYLETSPTIFKNVIISLSTIGLLTYEETDKGYFIDVKVIEDEAESS
jgi:hypothetical protein